MLYYISLTYRKCSSHRMVGEFSGTVVDQQYMMPHTWDMLGKSCITIVLFLWPSKCSSHRMVGEFSGTAVDQESMMPHTWAMLGKSCITIVFLAHLAKGNVSFCHHLASVVH